MVVQRSLFASTVLLCLASVAMAQEQTGSIRGTVRDAQQAVLAGAGIEARHLGTGAVVTTVSDNTGVFRFATVPPGDYDVVATFAGFAPQKFERVEVLLGQMKQLDFSMPLAGVSEQIEVVLAAPLVDVKQSASGFSLREGQLSLLAPGVDFQLLVPLLPGSNQEPKLGGLSIDGASAAENRFVADGMNITDIDIGLALQPINVDTIEELQVKSSGYTAEYGGATGGVVNVITRSGTETWRGDLRLYFANDALAAGPRPTLRRNLQDSSKAEYVTYPEDPYTMTQPAVSLGGPIVNQRAWFFFSYDPQFWRQDRTVTFNAPYTGTGTYTYDTYTHPLTASQTAQLGTRFRTRAAVNFVQTRYAGVLPRQAGNEPPTAQFDMTTRLRTGTISGAADWLASPRFIVSGRVGMYDLRWSRDDVRAVPRFWFARSNIGLLDVPASLQRVTEFATETVNWDGVNQNGRVGAQVDVTRFVHFAGEHTLKAGIQAEWNSIDANYYQAGNQVNLQWNRAVGGVRGKYGYYTVSSNTVNPRRGTYNFGKAAGSTPGLFVQDAWAVTPRLTINAGLRSERETLSAFSAEPSAPPIIQFGFADKLAPRLGAAWDVQGDGLWKIYGSWGMFYDVFKYSVAWAFGGIHAQQYVYTLDTYDWPTLLDSPACPPACPGTLLRSTNMALMAQTPIDPALRPMRLQEATAGVEHQLRHNVSVSARYVHKQLDRAVDDIGARDAAGNIVYTIGNPGYGEAGFAYQGVPLPKAQRDYDAIELTGRRALADRWSLTASYVWSRLWGNFSGLSQSDEEGRVAPYAGTVYDDPLMMFDEHGRPVYGGLATDRPHQLKVFGTYEIGFGLTGSVFQSLASGLPVTRQALVQPPYNFPVMYLGRGSDGRSPVLSQTDVYLQQRVGASARVRLVAGIQVTNLFNEGTPISIYGRETDTGISMDESAFYAGALDFQSLMAQQDIPKDPQFLMTRAFQAPRTVRLTLKCTF